MVQIMVIFWSMLHIIYTFYGLSHGMCTFYRLHVESTHSTVKSCRMYTLYTFYDFPIEGIHSVVWAVECTHSMTLHILYNIYIIVVFTLSIMCSHFMFSEITAYIKHAKLKKVHYILRQVEPVLTNIMSQHIDNI